MTTYGQARIQSAGGDRFVVAAFMLTLMTSASLLFWLQPMAAKFILPSVGGAPAVWNTAMMFFQAALLVGYTYAHLLGRYCTARTQTIVHLSLLTLCFLWLPIGVDTAIAPPPEGNPSWWLLSVLALGVGVPFAVIAGSAPLLQCWFAASAHKDADNPYFLYAASNIGSMAALFGFPLVAEPLLDLPSQSMAWSAVFALLLVLTALSAGLSKPWSRDGAKASPHATDASGVPGDNDAQINKPTAMQRFLWLALVLTSTSLMLGVTTHLTTDMAAVPLLWVVPLALFLLTFIIVFARRPLVTPDTAIVLLVIALLGGAILLVTNSFGLPWLLRAAAMLGIYFIIVLSCHTELAHIKPHKAWLTEFYLWIAVGGVLGGAFNALAAPLLFDSVLEFPIMMAVSITLIVATRILGRGENPRAVLALAVLCVALPLLAERAGLLLPEGTLTRERNFYGMLTVRDIPGTTVRTLTYGTTVHGVRDLTPGNALQPGSYYNVLSPIYDVFSDIATRPVTGAIGAVGLGVGTVSCHPTGGRPITFYEINPAVSRIAENEDYFAFMKGCGQAYEIIHGDGRLKLGQAAPGRYDLLFVDAFSSDSIPVHLLTREAFEVYINKLAPGGVLVLHITNRHLELGPVVAGIVRDLGLAAIHRKMEAADGDRSSSYLVSRNHMVAVARQVSDFGAIATLPGWQPLAAAGPGRTWTDSYTNIVGALDWGNGD